MKSFQKTKQGKFDEKFLEEATALYMKGNHWILIGNDNFEHKAGFGYAESEAELREELLDRMGNHVCIVDEPNCMSEEDSVAAYAPDEDGIVRPGAY
jgi:hypothetical protein